MDWERRFLKRRTPLTPSKTAITTDTAAFGKMSGALEKMDGPLGKVLDLISGMSGRLIVTGLGKNGHTDAKLAATFSSTGTPAYILHPAGQSHGDLGVVQPEDVT